MSGWHPSARGSRKWPDRFWRRVEKTNSCWLWTGSTRSRGYGQVFVDGRPQLSHRVSWELANGPVPDSQYVLHRCDNPPCVRPDHLFLGSLADNSQDMVNKGRGRYQGEEFAEWQQRRAEEGSRVAVERGRPHGTWTGYNQGCRDVCCTEAVARYHRGRREAGVFRNVRRDGKVIYERLAPLVGPDRAHGSYVRYQAGCRCSVCVTARRAYNREAQRKFRARRAEDHAA